MEERQKKKKNETKRKQRKNEPVSTHNNMTNLGTGNLLCVYGCPSVCLLDELMKSMDYVRFKHAFVFFYFKSH